MLAKPSDPTVPTDEAFAEAHRALIADSAIQFDLPVVERPRPSPVNYDSALLDFLNSPAMKIAFWILVALLAAWILYSLAIRLTGWSPPWRRSQEETVDESLQPGAETARTLLEEADALAAGGDFSEAAHLLLFRSLADIDKHRPGLLRPALTSRDIAVLPELPAEPRAAFAAIARLVERSLFAMRPLVQSDWLACRSAYERFAFAEGWRT